MSGKSSFLDIFQFQQKSWQEAVKKYYLHFFGSANEDKVNKVEKSVQTLHVTCT